MVRSLTEVNAFMLLGFCKETTAVFWLLNLLVSKKELKRKVDLHSLVAFGKNSLFCLKNYNRLLNVYIFLICPGSFGNGEICRKKSLKKQMWQLSQLQIIDQLYLEREKEK